MATPLVRSGGLAAAILALALVFCSMASWTARADAPASVEMGVVDVFISARATRDVDAVTALLDGRVRIIDTDRDLSAGLDGFYQMLPPGETLGFGARTQAGDRSISWTETVMHDNRPSWEKNLNWWMDDTSLIIEPRTPSVTLYTRVMRAVVVDARIAELTLMRTDLAAEQEWT